MGKIVTSLSTFIVLGLVARNYGEAGTGVYTLAVTYFAIFFIFADFGFNAYVLKKIQGKDLKIQSVEFEKLLGTRLLWGSTLFLIALGIVWFLPFATHEFAKAVIFGSSAIIVYGVFVTCNLIFQSKLKYELSAAATSVGALSWLFIITWFIALKLSVPFLVLSHLLGWLVIIFVALTFMKKLIQTLTPQFNLTYTKRLFKNSWPIAATLVLNVIYFRADAFILSYYKGISDTGIYNVAYQIFQSVLVLPTFIMNSFYPMMLISLKTKLNQFQKQIKLAALGLLLISLFLALILYSLSHVIIGLITGAGFSGSVISLQILSFSIPAYFLSSLFMWVMIAKKMYKKTIFVYALALFFNIFLNLIFIPHYSYIAASWITGVSEYLILGLQVVILWRR